MWSSISSCCKSNARLDGKTVVITGANSGIGKETARDLYGRGARVILTCRNMTKAKDAVDDLEKNPPSDLDKPRYADGPGELATYELDLSSFRSVRKCASNLLRNEPTIHILINNAGVAACSFEKTEDGYETQLQINYLGHFLLTLLLLPRLQSSAPDCRIINVSSVMHWLGKLHFDDFNMEKCYHPIMAYCQSKLANVLFTKELARRLSDADIHGINVYALHPGFIITDISRHFGQTLFKGANIIWQLLCWTIGRNIEQGAQTTIHCSVDEKAGEETGLYYSGCSYGITYFRDKSDQKAEKLWDETCRLLHLNSKVGLTELLKIALRQIAESDETTEISTEVLD